MPDAEPGAKIQGSCLCFLGELDKFVGQSNLLVGYLEPKFKPMGEQKGCVHTVPKVLPFTLKKN
jgi:hypothetical protein